MRDEINNVLKPNGQVSTRVESREQISNYPPQYRQQLYIGGGNEKHDRGQDDSIPDLCSGPHEALWHHVHTSSIGQRGLHFIQGGNPTIRDDLQMVPPDEYRRNLAEKSIQTWKYHFKGVLFGVEESFPMHLWCQMTPQAERQLLLLRQAY